MTLVGGALELALALALTSLPTENFLVSTILV